MVSLENRVRRVHIAEHIDEHERFPVGDEAWLETMRINDRIRFGSWEAPYDLVRRYLVTGMYDAGRERLALHNAILRAMSHGERHGLGTELIGETEDGRAARTALAEVMERYHRTRGPWG